MADEAGGEVAGVDLDAVGRQGADVAAVVFVVVGEVGAGGVVGFGEGGDFAGIAGESGVDEDAVEGVDADAEEGAVAVEARKFE